MSRLIHHVEIHYTDGTVDTLPMPGLVAPNGEGPGPDGEPGGEPDTNPRPGPSHVWSALDDVYAGSGGWPYDPDTGHAAPEGALDRFLDAFAAFGFDLRGDAPITRPPTLEEVRSALVDAVEPDVGIGWVTPDVVDTFVEGMAAQGFRL